MGEGVNWRERGGSEAMWGKVERDKLGKGRSEAVWDKVEAKDRKKMECGGGWKVNKRLNVNGSLTVS